MKKRKLIAANLNCIPILDYLTYVKMPVDILLISYKHPQNEMLFEKLKEYSENIYWFDAGHSRSSNFFEAAMSLDKFVGSLPWESYDSVVPSCISDGLLGQVLAKYASRFGCYFYPVDFAKVAFDKNKYLQKLYQDGLLVNKEMAPCDVREEDFPLVCKPALGSGGVGVYVAKNKEKLKAFLGDGSKKSAHYHFTPLWGDFRLESFIEGPVVSVCGYVQRGKCFVDLAYELLVTDLPYRAEYGCLWPLAPNLSQKKIQEVCQKVVTSLHLTDGPFMVDLVADNQGRFWVIDFSPRFSSTGIKMVKFVSQERRSYVDNGVQAYFAEVSVRAQSTENDRPIFFGGLYLPKGTVKGFNKEAFSRPDILEWSCNLEPGYLTMEPRIDSQVFRNGWVALTAEDRPSLMESYADFLGQLNVEFSETQYLGDIW